MPRDPGQVRFFESTERFPREHGRVDTRLLSESLGSTIWRCASQHSRGATTLI
jgi:hypothetical protein